MNMDANPGLFCKKDKLNYCEEALPFYWLAQALLNILSSVQGPQAHAGWNAFAGLKYGDMLKSARMFVSVSQCSQKSFIGTNMLI